MWPCASTFVWFSNIFKVYKAVYIIKKLKHFESCKDFFRAPGVCTCKSVRLMGVVRWTWNSRAKFLNYLNKFLHFMTKKNTEEVIKKKL